MADPVFEIYRLIVTRFISGTAAIPEIALLHPMVRFTISHVLAFIRGGVARGLIAFLAKAVNNGGWLESILHGFVGTLSFYVGGGLSMFMCFLAPEICWIQVLIFILLGGIPMYLIIMYLELWLRIWRSQDFKIGYFTLYLVVSAIIAAMTGLEVLCRKRKIRR